MSIHLESIVFNHSPQLEGSALCLRRNATGSLPVPEWQRGVTASPEDSMAAYAIAEAARQPIFITARFRRDPGDPEQIQVRADPLPMSVECGMVRPTVVSFARNGKFATEWFMLQDVQLWRLGVGRYDIAWRWQMRDSEGASWGELETTRHRIYVVLEAPKGPWRNGPLDVSNTLLPWTEVLDHACIWASGAHTTDMAATRITEAVNGLGSEVIRYGCEVIGLPQYTDPFYPVFDCSAFLERLRGGPGQGPFVNCTDCATIVATFANAVGCDLWQARMGTGQMFPLNPVLIIGNDQWAGACGGPGFTMHEVAWSWPCSWTDRVFDACLQVDVKGDPARPPREARVPANMPFEQPLGLGYRDYLVPPHGQVTCIPQATFAPATRVRRFPTDHLVVDLFEVGALARQAETADRDVAFATLRERFEFDAWAHAAPDAESLLVSNLIVGQEAILGWRVERTGSRGRAMLGAPPAREGLPRVVFSSWTPEDGSKQTRVRVEVFESSSSERARALMLQLLGEFEVPLISLDKHPGAGDVAVSDSERTVILFTRGNLLALVRNAGPEIVTVADFAGALDAFLQAAPVCSEHRDAPKIKVFRATGAGPSVLSGPGRGVSLQLHVRDPHDRDVTCRFLSRTGDLRVEAGVLRYYPSHPGKQEVQIYASGEMRQAAHASLEFESD